MLVHIDLPVAKLFSLWALPQWDDPLADFLKSVLAAGGGSFEATDEEASRLRETIGDVALAARQGELTDEQREAVAAFVLANGDLE